MGEVVQMPANGTAYSVEVTQLRSMGWYFVCETCNAHWFASCQLMPCPRCQTLAASTERLKRPWSKFRRILVRITRKNYEKARKAVEAALEDAKTVKLWEDTVARLGNLGSQELVAITVSHGGVVRTECELVHKKSTTTTQQPT
jgi:hypothetical protein